MAKKQPPSFVDEIGAAAAFEHNHKSKKHSHPSVRAIEYQKIVQQLSVTPKLLNGSS
jgi:hypothetical protein